MTTRVAACSCGQLRAICEGEPMRISVCHCLACQRRTGSVFGTQARWPKEKVRIEGASTAYTRPGDDSGRNLTFHFCPTCGTTLWWMSEEQPDRIAIAVGAFADPEFPPPRFSVYENRRHPWARIETGQHLERSPPLL